MIKYKKQNKKPDHPRQSNYCVNLNDIYSCVLVDVDVDAAVVVEDDFHTYCSLYVSFVKFDLSIAYSPIGKIMSINKKKYFQNKKHKKGNQ